MSLTQHKDVELEGFGQPNFIGCAELNELYQRLVDSRTSCDQARLAKIARQVPAFITTNRKVTSDSYEWFWCMLFQTNSGQTYIMFPWCKDKNRQDGSSSDRSIAVYSNDHRGKVEKIIEGFTRSFIGLVS